MDHTTRILRACDELARAIGMDQPIRVLLVDDEPGYCTLFKAMLGRIVGTTYAVDVASNVAIAEAAIRLGVHDIYVIDLRLDGHSGIDMVIRLQSEGEHFPFVMLTGAETDDRVALGRDCMMWMHKGYCTTPQELDRVIRYSIKNWLVRQNGSKSELPPTSVPE